MNCILIFILLAFCVLESKALSKYKEDAQFSPFRMNKINQIWQKAQKVRYSRFHTHTDHIRMVTGQIVPDQIV